MQLGQMPRAGGVRGLEALIGLDQGLALRGVDMKIIRHVEQDAGSDGDPADSFDRSRTADENSLQMTENMCF